MTESHTISSKWLQAESDKKMTRWKPTHDGPKVIPYELKEKWFLKKVTVKRLYFSWEFSKYLMWCRKNTTKVKANYTQAGDVKNKQTDAHLGSSTARQHRARHQWPATGDPTCQRLRTSLSAVRPIPWVQVDGGAPLSVSMEIVQMNNVQTGTMPKEWAGGNQNTRFTGLGGCDSILSTEEKCWLVRCACPGRRSKWAP